METISSLEKEIGGRWLGVSIYAVPVECKEGYKCPRVERFCEALRIGRTGRILVDPKDFTCPGARYAFGYGAGQKDEMIRRMVESKGISARWARELIERTPHCQDGIRRVGINVSDKPGVFIAQLQPVQVMRLIKIYQEKLERVFRTEISSVISACGNVAVKAIQTQDTAISFGCDDSRTFGHVYRDRLYAGIPFKQAESMFEGEVA